MKKYANLIHLLESFALSAVLTFFLFFMKRGDDSFFAVTLGFSAFAFLFMMLMIYIDGDKRDRGICKLFPIARSDLSFYGMLLQYALSISFAVAHNLGSVPISAVVVIYSLLPIIELAVIFIPAPKDAPPSAPTNERSELKVKSLGYYSTVLRNLIKKCEYQSLSQVMEHTADLLSRLDPEFSVQLDALENDISHKCVKIENALLTHNDAQLLVLERDLTAMTELVEKRIASYKYCLKDEGFYHTDDEVAMGQIDLLLDKFGLEYEEDLPTLNAPFEGEFFYQKALKFASDEYAALLADYNQQIILRLEQETADRRIRSEKRQTVLHNCSHAISALLVALAAGFTLFWHFSLQPNGLILSENEDGSYSVVGYNPIYGDELTVPESIKGKPITMFGREALMNSSIRKVTLPEGVVTVEYQSLKNCTKLETLVLPKSVTAIENYVFCYDDALTRIYYRGSAEEWEKIKIGKLGNDELEKIEIVYDYKD